MINLKNYLLLLFFFVIFQSSSATKENYYGGEFKGNPEQFIKLDRYAINTPKHVERSLNSLVNYLIKPAKNDLEKTRVIFRWIASHIAYDIQGYPLGNSPMVGTAKDAFKKRIAVCAGYSKLFKAMGELAGLEVEYITGLVKWGVGTFGGIGHAWNAVKLDGKWYLLDTTWAAGYIINFYDAEKIKFISKYNEFWFFTLPKHFVFTHYPRPGKWQLLKNQVSPYDFGYFPIITDSFFKNKLWFTSKPEGTLYLSPGDSISFVSPGKVKIKAYAKQNSKSFPSKITRKGNIIKIFPKFSNHGKHLLYILIKGSGDKKNSVGAVYQLFPKIKREMIEPIILGTDHVVKVKYPKYRKIPSGKELIFRFTSECADTATIYTSGKTYTLKNKVGYFNKKIFVKKGKVIVKVNYKCRPVRPKGLYTILVYEAE